MKYHLVLAGRNGFQKEETAIFENDPPPSVYYLREYQQLSPDPLPRCSCEPYLAHLHVKNRCFKQTASFYALGKHIVYYEEE